MIWSDGICRTLWILSKPVWFFFFFLFFPELNWLLISEHKSQRDLAGVSATVFTYKALLRLRTFLTGMTYGKTVPTSPRVRCHGPDAMLQSPLPV